MKLIKQLAILLSISFVAEVLEYLIPLPIAASIYGLVLMLAGLITKVIPLEKVEGAADFLVSVMPIMFIPPTVGIMSSAEVLQDMLVPLCVISVISTVCVMVFTGRTAQYILRKKTKGDNSDSDNASARTGENARQRCVRTPKSVAEK